MSREDEKDIEAMFAKSKNTRRGIEHSRRKIK